MKSTSSTETYVAVEYVHSGAGPASRSIFALASTYPSNLGDSHSFQAYAPGALLHHAV